MEKGKFGVRMCFYTVSAFVLAYLGYSTAVFLLAGVVLIAEKNEWATRQVIQAICLLVAGNLVSSILNVFDFLYDIPVVGSMWGVADGLLSALIKIFVLAFCIVGILKNIKGNDADIIGARKFADWAYGIVSAKPQAAPQAQNAAAAQPAQAQNAAAAQPVQAPEQSQKTAE